MASFRTNSVYRPPPRYSPPKHAYTLAMFPGYRLLKFEHMKIPNDDDPRRIRPGIRAGVEHGAIPLADITSFESEGEEAVRSKTVDSHTELPILSAHLADTAILSSADVGKLRRGQVSHVLSARSFRVHIPGGPAKAGSTSGYVPVAVKIVGDTLDDPVRYKPRRICTLL